MATTAFVISHQYAKKDHGHQSLPAVLQLNSLKSVGNGNNTITNTGNGNGNGTCTGILFKKLNDERTLEERPHEDCNALMLKNSWVLWIHLPNEKDWTLLGYKKIMTIESVNELIGLFKNMPYNLVDNGMLFLMRSGVNPVWEDEKNKNGGCFSYKVSNKSVHSIWKKVCYALLGGTISKNADFVNNISGVTISPKKTFCILKIWLMSCKYQDPSVIIKECGLNNDGCLFKQHVPEY